MNMFDFFHAVLSKVSGLVVAAAIAIGLVSSPIVVTGPAPTELVAQVVAQESATSTELLTEIEQLKREVDDAKKEAEAERLRSARSSAEAGMARAESDAVKAKSEQQRLQEENDKLKADAAAAATAVKTTQSVPQGTYCNGTNWAQCPSGQTFVCPTTGTAYCTSGTSNVQKGKNFRIDTISKLSSVIAIEESYITYLQDTSDQFRATSLTLSSYQAAGGLYGEARTLAISIANKEVGVISTLMSEARERIANLKSVLGQINQNVNYFVDEGTYNKLMSPAAVEADIASVRKSFDEILAEVMVALQYH